MTLTSFDRATIAKFADECKDFCSDLAVGNAAFDPRTLAPRLLPTTPMNHPPGISWEQLREEAEPLCGETYGSRSLRGVEVSLARQYHYGTTAYSCGATFAAAIARSRLCWA